MPKDVDESTQSEMWEEEKNDALLGNMTPEESEPGVKEEEKSE